MKVTNYQIIFIYTSSLGIENYVFKINTTKYLHLSIDILFYQMHIAIQKDNHLDISFSGDINEQYHCQYLRPIGNLSHSYNRYL